MSHGPRYTPPPATESCRCGKRLYLAREHALRALRCMKLNRSGCALMVYYCRIGSGWHVGSDSINRRKIGGWDR